jgi:hypothetical protein
VGRSTPSIRLLDRAVPTEHRSPLCLHAQPTARHAHLAAQSGSARVLLELLADGLGLP